VAIAATLAIKASLAPSSKQREIAAIGSTIAANNNTVQHRTSQRAVLIPWLAEPMSRAQLPGAQMAIAASAAIADIHNITLSLPEQKRLTASARDLSKILKEIPIQIIPYFIK
jgi:hypothetical protein